MILGWDSEAMKYDSISGGGTNLYNHNKTDMNGSPRCMFNLICFIFKKHMAKDARGHEYVAPRRTTNKETLTRGKLRRFGLVDQFILILVKLFKHIYFSAALCFSHVVDPSNHAGPSLVFLPMFINFGTFGEYEPQAWVVQASGKIYVTIFQVNVTKKC